MAGEFPRSCDFPEIEIDDPIQDIIEEEVSFDEGFEGGDPFETNLIELRETEEYIDDPLIDEPVTGAGNDDLWVDDTECDSEGSGGENCGVRGPEESKKLEPAE